MAEKPVSTVRRGEEGGPMKEEEGAMIVLGEGRRGRRWGMEGSKSFVRRMQAA